MFNRLAISVAALLVASCTGGVGSVTPRAQSAVAAKPASIASDGQVTAKEDPLAAIGTAPVLVPDSARIAGQWDVVSFEGYQPQRLLGTVRAAYADFREGGVGLRIECNYSGRAGTVRDGRFIASDNNDRIQTAMSCGPEKNARESRYFSFFDKGPTVERLGPDRLRLRAGTAELILAPPAVRRLEFLPTAAELHGRWRLLQLTRYIAEGGYSGIGLSEVPGRIVISGDRLFYSRCPQFGLLFSLSADGQLEKKGGTTPPAAPAGCRELAEPEPGIALPAQWDALRLLHANPMVEKAGKDVLLISTDRLGLLITKAPCKSLEQSDDHRTSRIVDCASPE